MNAPSIKIGLLLVGLSASVCRADIVIPEEPEAYQPFTIEIDIPHLYSYESPHVDVENKEIVLMHWPAVKSNFVVPVEKPIFLEVQGLPPGEYVVKTVEVPDSQLDGLHGEFVEKDAGFTVTVADAPLAQKIYAFYHLDTAHYFVTGSDEEANEIVQPQTGWIIIDRGFNAWHADDPAPSAAVPVCRFYSFQVNSHFYTGDEEECSKLQEEDHGWEYEGIAFQALIPSGGACPAGTDPVWRLFNNRVAELDSNHRFVASSETYRKMMAEGWLGEGVAFCSPPTAEL